jgi:hypothetical protein
MKQVIWWMFAIAVGPLWAGWYVYRGTVLSDDMQVIFGCVALIMFAVASVQIARGNKRRDSN